MYTKPHLTTLILGAGLFLAESQSQPISPFLVANNAWMSSDTYNGEIENLWGWMDEADFSLIRIGGHGALSQAKNLAWVYRTIDSVRSFGGEILLQVPSDYSEAQAKEYIRQINVVAGRNVRYWSIGNEPDWQAAGGGNDPQGVDLTVAGVANYTRAIAQGLRSIDPTILIFAGEFAWYNAQYLDGLLGTGANGITGKDANGHYYIDGIAWHHYDANSPNRSVAMEAEDIQARFATVNLRRSDKPMRWMIGEYNSNVGNDGVGEAQKAWSFATGQNFAITYDAGMRYGAFTICPWSMHESGGARTNYDLGLFDGSNGNYDGRSSYWHSWMLGRHMRANALARNDNQADVYAIAMGDTGGVSIMLLNQGNQTFAFEISLASQQLVAGAGLRVAVGAGINHTQTGTLPPNSTQMLIFDSQGNLQIQHTYSSALATSRSEPTTQVFDTSATPCQAKSVPGNWQVEDFCNQMGIQLETTTDVGGGQNIGYTDAGDYLSYSMNVTTAGNYRMIARLASDDPRSAVHIVVDGIVRDSLVLGNTGGWQTWTQDTIEIALDAGRHEVRLQYTDGGMNLNWLEWQWVNSGTVGLRGPTTSKRAIRSYQGFPSMFDLLGRPWRS